MFHVLICFHSELSSLTLSFDAACTRIRLKGITVEFSEAQWLGWVETCLYNEFHVQFTHTHTIVRQKWIVSFTYDFWKWILCQLPPTRRNSHAFRLKSSVLPHSSSSDPIDFIWIILHNYMHSHKNVLIGILNIFMMNVRWFGVKCFLSNWLIVIMIRNFYPNQQLFCTFSVSCSECCTVTL